MAHTAGNKNQAKEYDLLLLPLLVFSNHFFGANFKNLNIPIGKQNVPMLFNMITYLFFSLLVIPTGIK